MRMQWLRTAGRVLTVLALAGVLAGCSKAKEEAAVSIDEAKLNVSAAVKSGADKLASKTFSDAQNKLQIAQTNFNKGRHGYAKKQAMEASSLAILAKNEAEQKAAQKKATKKSTATAGSTKKTKTTRR